MSDAPPDAFQAPRQEHPFAPYIRILGKGKTGTRALSIQEARDAFGMLLRGEVEELQKGAFLMLLRVKEETGEELAGFVQAVREHMSAPPKGLKIDLDWSSYAGKKHQNPWFILSLLLLAQAGHRVLVHGADGHTPGRLYTEEAMRALGLPVATGWADAAQQVSNCNLCYLPLRHFCYPLHELMQLRPLLGLRSPVNTLARMINPAGARASIQSVFHPAYAALHQQADHCLGQPAAGVFRGESGEVEVRPQADTKLSILLDGRQRELILPRRQVGRVEPQPKLDVNSLRILWRGTGEDPYGEAAVLTTAATALLVLGCNGEYPDALASARRLWQQRDTARLD